MIRGTSHGQHKLDQSKMPNWWQ